MSKRSAVEQQAFEEGRTFGEAGLGMNLNTYVGPSGCRVAWEEGYAYGAGFTACMDGLSSDSNPFVPDHLRLQFAEGYFSAVPTREQWEEACQQHWDAA